MFSKEELKEIKTNFWDGFKIHMKKKRGVGNRKINWINYPSEIKLIFVRLDANHKSAKLCFDIQGKDDEIRKLIYEQMTELKFVLESQINYPTNWDEELNIKDQTISRIYWELKNVNFYDESDKLKIYKFLEERLIEFDRFYSEYKDILISLTD